MNEAQKTSIPQEYKFKELKTYSSLEWLAENKKRYRQVFNASDTRYIYAELSMYNKYFDIDNWDLNVQLKCFNADKKKLLCKLDVSKSVSKNENIIYIREGWGNKKKGVFWKKGTYKWEVWVDDQRIGVKYFYVEDLDLDVLTFDDEHLINSLKLYEGHFDDVIYEERKYLREFSSTQTRYVHVEFGVNNLFLERNWNGEFVVKFFNEAHELKGQIIKLHKFNVKDSEVQLTAGWGSNVKGSWAKGKYTAEIIFMNKLVGWVPFVVGDDHLTGLLPLHVPKEDKNLIIDPEEIDGELTFKDVFSRLDEMIGLEEIKSKIKDHAQYLKYLKLRKEKGFDEDSGINMHSVFIGNPGTGKTSVAKMLGMLYRKLGLLSKGHVVEVDRAELVGEYIGQTAPKVKNVLQKARGGVLFIDEAYSLARASDDKKDFGKEVIEILVKEMSNGPGDIAVVAAGYPQQMADFMGSNPGLKSRFKHEFTFKDYKPDELLEIAYYAADQRNVIISKKSEDSLKKIIQKAYRNRNSSFGNARFINDLLDEVKINMGLRIMSRKSPQSLSKKTISTLLPSDFNNLLFEDNRLKRAQFLIDTEELDKAVAELNELTGMQEIKKRITEWISLIKYYKEIGKDTNSILSFHTVFIGNPGTGKTTVARILSRIYKALGILEKGHLVETDRQGLVAGFIGQTAIKTNEKINEALGGVLYIDEAYSLSSTSSQGDYGSEAIQTLLKRMEDDRGQFFVFVAGYTDNMKQFLKANPGLSSRFDNVLHFQDYSEQELLDIAIQMLKSEKYKLSNKVNQVLQEKIWEMRREQDKYFGNARTIRRLTQDIIKNHNIRMGATSPELRTKRSLQFIEVEDVIKVKFENLNDFDKRRIGF